MHKVIPMSQMGQGKKRQKAKTFGQGRKCTGGCGTKMRPTDKNDTCFICRQKTMDAARGSHAFKALSASASVAKKHGKH